MFACYYILPREDNRYGFFLSSVRFASTTNHCKSIVIAYKTALRELRKELYTRAYKQWLSVHKAIRDAKADRGKGYSVMPLLAGLAKDLFQAFQFILV